MAETRNATPHSSNPTMQQDIDFALSQAIELYASGAYQESKCILDVILQAQPNNADALHHMGLIAQHYGNAEAAIDLIMQSLEQHPSNYRCHYNLGLIYELQENTAQAYECYETAVQLNPECIEAQLSLGGVLIRRGRYKEAIHHFNKLLKKNPESVPVINKAGLLFNVMGYPHIALGFLRKAIALDPKNSLARLFLSDAFKTMGKIDESKKALREVLDLNPINVYAYCSLSEDEKFRRGDPVFTLLERVTERSDVTARIRRDLHFSLGKMYADIGEYGNSFSHYARGNDLRREANGGFDRREFTDRIDTLIAGFDHAFFSRAPRGSDSRKPIFIVGMPRSGTSLTEQILASHPGVYGGGELSFLSDWVQKNFAVQQARECLRNLADEKTLRAGAESYLSRIEAIAADANYVTDKMPANQLNVWAIALLFPNARVIHCRRDARDNCLACFIKNFAKPHNYADDLGDIAFFYREADRLMRHWKAQAPIAIMDMHYERLVNDTEAAVRALLAFCGLAWNDACLDFHKTERTVHTASRLQVRKKIYTSSIDRWRSYEPFLGPLFEELDNTSPR